MNNLSKNEQIILYVAVFVAVAVGGLFLFLFPAFDKISDSKAVYNRKNDELKSLQAEYGPEAFDEVAAEIEGFYNDGKDASAMFYGIEYANYNVDRLVRGILSDLDIEIDNLAIIEIDTETLKLERGSPRVSTYDAKEEGGFDVEPVIEGEDGEDIDLPPVDSAEDGDAPPVELDENNEVDMIAKYANSSLEGAMDNFEKSKKTPAVISGMRSFLVNQTKAVGMQEVEFEIAMTQEEADRLSMHIYKLHELPDNQNGFANRATYISSMTRSNARTNQLAGEVLEPGQKYYKIKMVFYIYQPMDTPVFTYKERFGWN
jgi:hypothetical protein